MPNNAEDPDLDQPILEVLEPGERLLRSGRPKQGLLLQSSDWLYIPPSLLWCGFAIAWDMGLWDGDEHPLPPLGLIPNAQRVHEIIRQAQGGPSWAGMYL